MNQYKVTADGVGGSQFVYTVLADSQQQAIMDVYTTHGIAVRSGELDECLTPWFAIDLVESAVAKVIREAINLKF